MGRASRAAALIVAGFLSGCGTLANINTGAREGWKNVQIYGGVRRDVQSGEEWFAHSWTPLKNLELMQDLGAVVGLVLVGIDVPLSVAADTVTLPVTIPISIWASSSREANGSRPAVNQQPLVSPQPVVSPPPAVGSQPVVSPQPAVGSQPVVSPQPAVSQPPVVSPPPAVGSRPLLNAPP